MKTHLEHKPANNAGKILIVEDDPSLIEILEDVLRDEGYITKCLPESLDIVAVANDFKPDLVILDYLLPTINGGELCSQLKKSNSLNDISVIIYSAYPKVLTSMGNYGCDIFIEKPFDLDDLLLQIRQLLSAGKLKCKENIV